jgi:hypothetical protein
MSMQLASSIHICHVVNSSMELFQEIERLLPGGREKKTGKSGKGDGREGEAG